MLIPYGYPPQISLQQADFPPSLTPYLVQQEDVGSFWLVNTGHDILAFDRRTPFRVGSEPCRYSWVAANGRFKDPCSGSKFALDGTLIEEPAVRDLIAYPVTINKNGTITIYVDLDVDESLFAPRNTAE